MQRLGEEGLSEAASPHEKRTLRGPLFMGTRSTMPAMPFTFTPTVLVIDDEPHIRRFVRAALEEEGCEVHEADRVERA